MLKQHFLQWIVFPIEQTVYFSKRKNGWLLEHCSPPLRKNQFLSFNKSFHSRNKSFPLGKTSFLSGKISFPCGKKSFPRGTISFLSFKKSFLQGNSSFPSGKNQFLLSQTSFLSCYESFPFGKSLSLSMIKETILWIGWFIGIELWMIGASTSSATNNKLWDQQQEQRLRKQSSGFPLNFAFCGKIPVTSLFYLR